MSAVRISIDEDALRITVVLRGETHTGSWDDDGSADPDPGSSDGILAAALCAWDGDTGPEFWTTVADLEVTGFDVRSNAEKIEMYRKNIATLEARGNAPSAGLAKMLRAELALLEPAPAPVPVVEDCLPFVPTEVAYRKLTMRGAGPWKRRVFTDEKTFDRFIASHEDYEIETRDAVVGGAK